MANCLINGTNNNTNDGRAIQILNFLVGKGFTTKQACAICGNAYVESNRDYNPKSMNKNDCNATKTECGPSYGLFQWHDVCTRKKPDGSWDESSCSGRFTNLKNYCNSHGLDYTTMKGQLEFLWHENAGNFTTVFKAKTNESIESLVKWWEDNWEHCSTCNHSDRVKEANRVAGFFNQMNKTECKVDTSGETDTDVGTFSCDDTESTELTSSVDVSESYQSSSESASSNGSGDTTNSINTRPLFVGDSFALRVWNAGEHTLMRKTASALTKSGWYLDDVAKNLKAYTSNVNNKPKLIVVCCGYDHKFTNKVTWLNYKSGGIKKIKRGLRKILAAARGYDVKIIESLYPINLSCETDYQYRAASIFNDAVQSLIDDGDEVEFTFVHFPDSTKNRLRQQETCVKSKKESTYTEKGFEIISNQICAAF